MLTRMSPALAVAKLGQHPFAVGRPDPDAVALLQPQRNQSRGEPIDRGLEFKRIKWGTHRQGRDIREGGYGPTERLEPMSLSARLDRPIHNRK